jgi:hypothetical protein
MLRILQNTIKNVDAQFKAVEAMKRGMLVVKDLGAKTVSATATGADAAKEVYFVDRGLVNDPILSIIGTLSDYEDVLETIKIGEFVNLVAPYIGERYATDAYTGAETDFVANNYLAVTDGKFIASPANAVTKFKSCGIISDNGHKLVKVEIVA